MSVIQLTTPDVQRSVPAPVKILVIDDNRGDRVLCERHLARAGSGLFVSTAVSSGAEALESMASAHFDGVLLDYFLPDSQGLALVPELRSRANDPELPIIMLTGAGDEELAAHVLTHGVDDYLPKSSLTPRVLESALDNALEKSALRRQAERNQQLLEATNRELLDRNKEVRKFYQTVSHELKTPLTAIREYNSLILDGVGGDASPKHSEFLTSSIECCDVLGRMVDDLCDTAAIEQGKLSLKAEPANLGILVSKLSPTLYRIAERVGVDYSCTVEPYIPSTLLDSDRITQLLTNLVNNAVRHTPSGGNVQTMVTFDRANAVLVLGVSDNGCGISSEDQLSVFGRFFQARDNSETAHQGMGIGLFLCRAIAEMHGGDISVDSTLGVGSTFSIRIPVRSES